jgi:hypothetical protein
MDVSGELAGAFSGQRENAPVSINDGNWMLVCVG